MASIITVTLNPAIDRVIEVAGFAVGAHQRGRLLDRVPAGKGVNVSRVLASLGVESIATGFVGAEELGFFEHFLAGGPERGAGPAVRPQLLAVHGHTRENITIIDPKSGIETHIRDLGFKVSPADVDRLRKKLNLLAKPGAVVALCGSLPPGMAIDAAVGLVDLAMAKGASVAVDGSGALLRALADRSLWLLKPNIQELAEAVGRAGDSLSDDDVVTHGRALGENAEVVIVSRGSAGGYLFAEGSVWLGQVSIDAELIRSTVGCGDALLAGFIAARLRGHDPRESYRHALAVATAAALEPAPGCVDPAEVANLLPAASVEAAA
jgi:1-phosphofructokinase family hexose kinase